LIYGQILTAQAEQSAEGIKLIYYGKGCNGPFKLIFEKQSHVFFIPRSASFSPPNIDYERISKPLKSFNLQDVDVIYLKRLDAINQAKAYCQQYGIRAFELDVSCTERFLMERFIFSRLQIKGPSRSDGGLQVYVNPEIAPSKTHIEFSKFSLDIETGIHGELFSIAYAFESETVCENLVIMGAETSQRINDELIYCDSEKKMLQLFLQRFHAIDPDIICGWHVIGFDLMFLEKKCQEYELELKLGREGQIAQLEFKQGRGYFAKIEGRLVLDGPPVLRGAFYQFNNFKLETVAQEVLGQAKDIASNEHKVAEIERRYREDKVALAKYNLLDCTLVNGIFNKLKIVELLQERSAITGLVFDRLNVSTAAFDFIFLPKLHRKGFVAPNRMELDRADESSGGLVFEPKKGLHKAIMVFDFKSLYPSIIKTFFIGPYSLVHNQTNTVKTPDGFEFSSSHNILPSVIDNLFQLREAAKKEGHSTLSQAIKILMNSFYGIMGSSRSRFYHASLPQAITTTGHFVLNTTRDFFENHGLDVVYGDTDSVFVASDGKVDPNDLAQKVNDFFARLLANEYNVVSYLECEYEHTYELLYFSPARGGQGAAKKRYAGIKNNKLEFTGMEFVRSDWTELAKNFQYRLFEVFFRGEDPEEFIKNEVKKLEQGVYDSDLIYTKRLSKPAHEYVKNIPVHVKAALKLDHQGPYPLREISYVMTKTGPEPIQFNPIHFDYNHYIEKQLKPIADDVLSHFDRNFESIRLGDQLTLF
jgi:DNA polymerase-2